MNFKPNLVRNFSKDIEKVARDIRKRAKESKDKAYLFNLAQRLENMAESYKETDWEYSMGDDL